jgi:NAD-dependent DNA ligase
MLIANFSLLNSFDMLRTTILFTVIYGLSIPLIGQETETRHLESFNKIKVATGIEVTIVEGTENEIVIFSDGIELEEIKSEIKGGELLVKIKTKLSLLQTNNIDVQARITYVEELESIIANSGASIESENNVSSSILELRATSGASLDLSVICDDIEAGLSSGAEMDIEGESGRLDLRFNTGSSFRGFDLHTQKARVKGGTGGSAEISVSEYIKTNVNTGASIEYKGNPSKKDINKGTGGEVRHREGNLD